MMRLLLASFALLALAACQKASEPAANRSAAAPPMVVKAADYSHKGAAAPTATFSDASGKQTSLKAFAGKPTLVNLWASWCAPCVKELPTLDKVARARASELNVVAISQDTGPHASVEAFLKAHSITTLSAYQDPKMALSGALDAQVLPTSILFDASGKEIWRYVGDQDWTTPEATRLIDEAAAQKRP
ncbi:MAG TPA: TlpA disulfide reductase family protein [Sphingomicrobium sp.]|nr:TlpA disulfide reductase family protein [Sphingomicrobium sp.]